MKRLIRELRAYLILWIGMKLFDRMTRDVPEDAPSKVNMGLTLAETLFIESHQRVYK